MSRSLRNLIKSNMRRALEIGQRFGVNITPVHFYSDIPNFRQLRSNDNWKRPYTFVGANGCDPSDQLAFVRDCCTPFSAELGTKNIHERACESNGEAGYGRGEAALLYAFARRHKPGKIIQIGCGVSTAVLVQSANDEPEYSPEIVCVEPYPTEYLSRLAREGRITLLQQKAQEVRFDTLADLGDGDFLFVDSTHTLVPGSEVSYTILEVMPRLQAGVWVHFHDIHFPFNYNQGLLHDVLFFSHEELLLHAFLADNPRYALSASMTWLHGEHRDELKEALADYEPCTLDRGLRTSEGDCASSAYLRVIN